MKMLYRTKKKLVNKLHGCMMQFSSVVNHIIALCIASLTSSSNPTSNQPTLHLPTNHLDTTLLAISIVIVLVVAGATAFVIILVG